MSTVFTDKTSLKAAVNAWIADPAAALLRYGDINNWDVSQVTDMSNMFNSASTFTGNIKDWDVSQVTDMSFMFHGASAFTADISGWNVSNVTLMSYMFSGASLFNRNISGWNVGNVQNMSRMFLGASAFNGDNGDINDWDVSQVTDMSYMFYSASAFNRNISEWNVGAVTDMSYMFIASAFNANISGWDVRNIPPNPTSFSSGALLSANIPKWGTWPLQNASLSGLVVGTSTLSPAFKDSTRSYTASVAYYVSSITVTKYDPDADITVNGNVPPLSGTIPLYVGLNIISVIVRNGLSTMSYSITVTRAAPPPPHTVYSSSSVTELVDIVDAGSGNIITNAERASIEKMSAILEHSSGIPKLSIEVGVDHSLIKTLVIISQTGGPPMLYENDLVTVFANAIV